MRFPVLQVNLSENLSIFFVCKILCVFTFEIEKYLIFSFLVYALLSKTIKNPLQDN